MSKPRVTGLRPWASLCGSDEAAGEAEYWQDANCSLCRQLERNCKHMIQREKSTRILVARNRGAQPRDRVSGGA